MEKVNKRVGFVATGDELINGDILNSNSQYFAQRLVENGIQPGRQVVVSDDQKEIESAIHYLLQDHNAVITIGGLGPTEDDRTRFALAAALDVELIFNNQVWQWVVDIITSKGLEIPETNRQQALLPEGSHAIYNANGTAAACYISFKNHDIFMLPGPPNECFPIFNEAVLPRLLEENYAYKIYKNSWLLMGASESSIAAQLEPLMSNSNCALGYRVHYPYLEIKLRSEDEKALEKLSKQFTEILKPKLISESRQTASEQFFHYLETTQQHITIIDNATHGLLESTLNAPTTQHSVHFCHEPSKGEKPPIAVTVTGLEGYWKGNKDQSVPLPITIQIEHNHKKDTIDTKVSNRGKQSIDYAVEIICWELLRFLSQTQVIQQK